MKTLDEAQAAQAELDTVDTQLSAAINAIEDGLRSRIHMRIEIPCEGAVFKAIAFGKHSAEWRLLVKLERGEWTPLNSAARARRAEALSGGHIRRLIDQSVSLLRSELEARAAATDEANDLLTQLGAQTTHQEH